MYTNKSNSVESFLFELIHFPKSYIPLLSSPNYLTQLWPYFLGLVIVEHIALIMKGKGPGIGQSLNSLSHGILSETVKILTIGFEISVYAWIYEKYRLIDLDWEMPLTWYVMFLGLDLAYYWAHRFTHEVNFLWAQHQVHHSSEDFNITVSVRHPISHNWINSFFYIPLAFVIPPSHCIAYQQFNLIYQAWIHTSLIGYLGPLEFILNTPTHHKAHHGFLIIWDRLFGTFQDLKPEKHLVFGIVFQHASYNTFWQMWHKFPCLYERIQSTSSWSDAFKVIFYGPSWIPGVNAPRLGRDQDKLDVKPRQKYRVKLPIWTQMYLIFHFLALAGIFHQFAQNHEILDELSIGLTLIYIVFTLTTIGMISEGNPWSPHLEILRCGLFMLLCPVLFEVLSYIIFLPSILTWLYVLSRKESLHTKLD